MQHWLSACNGLSRIRVTVQAFRKYNELFNDVSARLNAERRDVITTPQTITLNVNICIILVIILRYNPAHLERDGIVLEERRNPCVALWRRNLAQAALAMLTERNNRRQARGTRFYATLGACFRCCVTQNRTNLKTTVLTGFFNWRRVKDSDCVV